MFVGFLVAAVGCPLADLPPIPGVDPRIAAIVQQEREEQEQRAPPPPGFDCRLWNGMTTDQKIDVSVAASASPEPIKQDSEAAVLTAIKNKLKDPDSAEFRDVKRRGAFDYCGWVNAKNSYGGYSGYSLFFANANWTIILPADASDPSVGAC